MKGPILVIGATGLVGHHLVNNLTERGARVRALVRDMDKAHALLPREAELVIGDLRDRGSMRSAIEGTAKIYLLTPGTPEMVEFTKEVIELAERSGTEDVVMQSALGAETAPPNTIGWWHRQCEMLLERRNIGYTFIRPNQLMQNFLTVFGPSILAQGTINKPCGDGRTSFIDARDVAEAAAVVLDGNWHEGKKYNLTGPQAMTNAEAVERIGEALQKPVTYFDTPAEQVKNHLLKIGLSEDLVREMMEMFVVERFSSNSLVTHDFHRLTGKPPRTFQTFARDYFQGLTMEHFTIFPVLPVHHRIDQEQV